jgi:excisionase family DNA binding protein
MSVPEVLSTHDVARYCAVTPRTVLRWVDAGVLPGFQTGGGRRRIQKDDLIRFMRGRGMALPDELLPARNRVAIVDDDLLHVQMMQRVLTSMAPHLEIRTAADGFSAGALLFSFRPHLVFLDLVMPGLDGFDVCRRIRAEPDFEATGVCIVTGHMSAPVRRRLNELGADECLTKPFRRADLRPVLERFVPIPASSRFAAAP